MCGIAGEFAFEGEQVTAVAGRMTSALRHRGPDSSGHYLSPARNVILVNTRLAIVEHLRGEFAFAPCDRRQHTLWLGRDRFGVKPLYYALSPRSLLFGSEIKAIFSSPVIKRELNPSFIYSYLHGLPPPDETPFVGRKTGTLLNSRKHRAGRF